MRGRGLGRAALVAAAVIAFDQVTKAIVRSEIAARRPELVATTVTTVAEAVPVALAMANPGDVVVLMYEAIDPLLEVLSTLGARPVTQPRELARLRNVAHV